MQIYNDKLLSILPFQHYLCDSELNCFGSTRFKWGGIKMDTSLFVSRFPTACYSGGTCSTELIGLSSWQWYQLHYTFTSYLDCVFVFNKYHIVRNLCWTTKVCKGTVILTGRKMNQLNQNRMLKSKSAIISEQTVKCNLYFQNIQCQTQMQMDVKIGFNINMVVK